jgi:hypothetical protein
MKVDPKVIFWLSFIAWCAQGISAGTVHLTNIVPAEAIPSVTSWMGLIVFLWMGFQTALNGYAGPGTGPLAKPPTMDEANKIVEQAKGAGN